VSFLKRLVPLLPALALLAATLFCVAGKLSAQPNIMLGVDVLDQRGFDILNGKRVGLLTHQAGVNRNGTSTIDIMRRSPHVKLVALFCPEHGLYGDAKANENVATQTDRRTGLPVYSLFGSTRRPTPQMLAHIDVLVIDLQDVGTRSYTYISAMRYAMEECFRYGKEVVVLDRPNPLGGLKVDGPMIDDSIMSYVGAYRIPYVYGLTIGELALMAKDTPGWLQITEAQRAAGKLTVVPMTGWSRNMRWTDTGLKWRETSPFVQDLNAAFGYPMTGLGCQLGGFSHGLGASFPFRVLEYNGRTPEQVCAALNAERIPGLSFRIITVSVHGKQDKGVYVDITDWDALRPTEVSFHMMKLAARWARESGRGNPFAVTGDPRELFCKHVGDLSFCNALIRNAAAVDIQPYLDKWAQADSAFQSRSKKFWIYR
jgi:uncharacterized protein YbbC (DUF1343 family)